MLKNFLLACIRYLFLLASLARGLKFSKEELKDLIGQLSEDGCNYYDPVIHETCCFFCGAILSFGGDHELDCPYIEAKKLLKG